MIRFACTNCKAGLSAKPEAVGRVVKCPKCGERTKVEAAPVAPAPAQAPAKPVFQPDSDDDGLPYELEGSLSKQPAIKRPAPKAGFVPDPKAKAGPPKPVKGREVRERLEQLVQGFNGDFKRPRRGVGYRSMELIVFFLILLLPALYVAMIAGAGWGTWWYATHSTGMLTAVRGRGAIFMFILYAAPIAGGAAVVVSMILPLFFWPPSEDGPRRSINRSGQPLLFAMVDRLCDTVGARRPSRIDVDCTPNASAGLVSPFRNDLVLTIGLPFVAGLTAPQLVGVLAHEFGHFTQGFTSRLNYFIRSILRWFAVAAHAPNPIERALFGVEVGGEVGCLLLILALGVKICVSVARLSLHGCFLLGWWASMVLLRRMEYDADAYEFGVVGSEVFEDTTRKLPLLARGYELSLMVAISKAPGFHELPEDLAGYAAALAENPTAGMKKFGVKSRKQKTKAFDTHPADKDRINAARRADAPGIYHVDLPATALFSNFEELCRNSTFDFYREVFGRSVTRNNMVPNEKLLFEGRLHGDPVPPPVSHI